MEATARAAERDELATVAAMAAEAIEALRPLRGGAVWSNTDARTEPIIDGLLDEHDRSDATIVVGLIDGVPVGYSAAHAQPLHDGRAMARITDLYVIPDGRRVGVGEAMILELERWARSRGLVALDSIALPGDRDTKNFFETFGMVARSISVNRSIES